MDPSGHDPVADWEAQYIEEHGYEPTEEEIRDFIFSLIFSGSGENGAWTDADWAEYYANRDSYWNGDLDWKDEKEDGWEAFTKHSMKLASYYTSEEHDQFVRAFGAFFGGIPYKGSVIDAAVRSFRGPPYDPFYEGGEGFDARFYDPSEGVRYNPSHHFAGMIFAAYFFGPVIANAGNYIRDGGIRGDYNPGDMALSDEAIPLGFIYALNPQWLPVGVTLLFPIIASDYDGAIDFVIQQAYQYLP